MATWTTLTYAALEVLSATKMNQNQANFTALIESATGSPIATTGLHIIPGSAVHGIHVDMNYDQSGILVDSENTDTANYACFRGYGKSVFGGTQDISNGYAFHCSRNLNEAGANALGTFDSQHTADTYPALQLFSHGTGGCLSIDQIESNGLGIDLDTASTFGIASWFTGNNGVNYNFFFHADGNNANRAGIALAVGEDVFQPATTQYFMSFCDGDWAEVGSISAVQGTVSYNAFTGSHYGKRKDSDNRVYKYGEILCCVNTEKGTGKYKSQAEYTIEISKTACDKKVFGIYASNTDDIDNLNAKHEKVKDKNGKDRIIKTAGKPIKKNHDSVLVHAVGDGHILVCSEGGNIEVGDYLCTSNTEGHGMKQDDDLLHNYTVAKSLEIVDWSKEPDIKKLICCTYHAA